MAQPRKSGQLAAALLAIKLWRFAVAALLAIVGGYLAFSLAASGVARKKNPAAALLFVPGESTALAARADQLYFSSAGNPPPLVRIMALAALRQQAVNPRALRLLGYYADFRREPGKAMALINVAEKLSRREPGTQLWLIEASARNGDNVRTLAHYDILLRTKPDSQAVLFPRLTSALDDAEIRKSLIPYMRTDKGWVTGFVYHAISRSKDPASLVALLVEARGFPQTPALRNQSQLLINRLAAEKHFADARRVYLLLPGARAGRLSSPAFDSSDRDGQFAAIGWQIFDDAEAGGAFTGKGPPTLAIYVDAATTRKVATKLLYLPEGRHFFTSRIASLDRGTGGWVRWNLRCPTGENQEPVWSAEAAQGNLQALLEIPAGCPVQYLDLVASGGNGQTGLEASIAAVRISIN